MALHLFDLPGFDYNRILNTARRIDRVNFMDLAHDHILTGKSMQALKYYYRTVNEIDYTINQDTCNVCNCCNEIKPVSAFRTRTMAGKTFTENVCRKCSAQKNKERIIKSKNHIMKLVKIEVQGGSTSPQLTFSRKGMFSINSAMADLIQLKKDDQLIFLKDEEKPKNWYVSVCKSGGFSIQTVTGKYTQRKFQNRSLLAVMVKSLVIPESCNTFLIGPSVELEGVRYYPLMLNKR